MWQRISPYSAVQSQKRRATEVARHLLHGTFDDLIPYVGVAVRAAPKLGVVLEVIVVDNDSEGSAAPIVAQHFEREQIAFRYFLEPVKNISMARNRAVANASGDPRRRASAITSGENSAPLVVTRFIGSARTA